MHIYSAPSVAHEPVVHLERWRVIEVQLHDAEPYPTRHFVGILTHTGDERVSSPVITFNALLREGVTRSGRIYKLVGGARIWSDALATWNAWKRVNKITSERDVTDDVLLEIQKATREGNDGVASS